MRKLSILLLRNETLPAEAIAGAFNSRGDIEVVGTSTTSENTIELVQDLKPDVLIIGVQLYRSVEPRRIIDAISEGHRIGLSL